MNSFLRAHWLPLLAPCDSSGLARLVSYLVNGDHKAAARRAHCAQSKGVGRQAVRILIPEVYELNLVFERAGHEFEELNALLGTWGYRDGKPIPSGVHVPVRWSLVNSATGAIAAAGEIDSFGSVAWSASEVDRRLATVSVSPGNYKFSAQVLRDVSELAQFKCRLAMQLRPKASSTWQITLVWWGSLANFLLVWPTIAVLSLLLLWRAGLAIRAGQLPSAK